MSILAKNAKKWAKPTLQICAVEANIFFNSCIFEWGIFKMGCIPLRRSYMDLFHFVGIFVFHPEKWTMHVGSWI